MNVNEICETKSIAELKDLEINFTKNNRGANLTPKKKKRKK